MAGLYRKEYFGRRLARDFENARKEQHALTLLFLDIDHFDQVNKTNGYPTGDQALKIVSGILLESVRTIDWAAPLWWLRTLYHHACHTTRTSSHCS